EAVAAGTGPDRLLVTLGYAGWGPGQLEQEIAHNAWLTVEATPALIFDTPADERIKAAFSLLGINPAFLAPAAGHA
ncbi:MAG: YqgE/AlgH family protein, partial [Burkholderiaceae bacterium]|nr:YqgE/AlgH family protein [Burkholderiaceae bacterium]